MLPDLGVAHRLFRFGGQIDGHVLETEEVVDLEDEVEEGRDLGLDLLRRAEDVGVVLAEGPDPGQTGDHSRSFVAVEAAEIRDPPRQVAVGVGAAPVEQTVRRTVHGLDARRPLLDLLEGVGEEHVVAVVVVVARALPQLDVEDLRGDDLVIAVGPVLLPHELEQGVVDQRAARVEEGARRRLRVERKQIEFATERGGGRGA